MYICVCCIYPYLSVCIFICVFIDATLNRECKYPCDMISCATSFSCFHFYNASYTVRLMISCNYCRLSSTFNSFSFSFCSSEYFKWSATKLTDPLSHLNISHLIPLVKFSVYWICLFSSQLFSISLLIFWCCSNIIFQRLMASLRWNLYCEYEGESEGRKGSWRGRKCGCLLGTV